MPLIYEICANMLLSNNLARPLPTIQQHGSLPRSSPSMESSVFTLVSMTSLVSPNYMSAWFPLFFQCVFFMLSLIFPQMLFPLSHFNDLIHAFPND